MKTVEKKGLSVVFTFAFLFVVFTVSCEYCFFVLFLFCFVFCLWIPLSNQTICTSGLFSYFLNIEVKFGLTGTDPNFKFTVGYSIFTNFLQVVLSLVKGDIDSIKEFGNVMALLSFFRVFATETSQFLAPYEASVKSRSGSDSPPENAIGNSSMAVNIPDTHRHIVGVSASHVSTWWRVDYITSVGNLSSLTQYMKIKFPLLWLGC